MPKKAAAKRKRVGGAAVIDDARRAERATLAASIRHHNQVRKLNRQLDHAIRRADDSLDALREKLNERFGPDDLAAVAEHVERSGL